MPRLIRYLLRCAVALGAMVLSAVFLSVVVVNYGGYIDEIFRAEIDGAIMGMGMAGAFKDIPPDQLVAYTEQLRWQMEEARGLHEPFLLRSLRWSAHAILLDLGEAQRIAATSYAIYNRDQVANILRERLPNTLLLSGLVSFFIFITSVGVALPLSQKHGGILDRFITLLSPLSAAPSWIYGILLIIIFARQLNWLPYGGMFDELPPANRWGYIPIVLKHMLLPAAAIFLSAFFQSVYTWRTFFVLHASEDYVEMARAKGLPNWLIQNRYILRPALPFIVTAFSLVVISFWQNSIALELVFKWPGIGALLLQAIRVNERGITLGILVIFTYLLALTVLILDVVYALLDPRIRMESDAPRASAPAQKRRFSLKWRGTLWEKRPAALRWSFTSLRELPAFGSSLLVSLQDTWSEFRRYPSALLGLFLLLIIAGMATYITFAMPLSQAIVTWRSEGTERLENPRMAEPAWVNWLLLQDQPETIRQSSTDGTAAKQILPFSDDITETRIDFTFNYPYNGGYPQEIILGLDATYRDKRPLATLFWLTPDGREIELATYAIEGSKTWYLSLDERLQRKLERNWQAALFGEPIQTGTYTLRVSALAFEPDTEVNARMILHGQLFGWAGTDDNRRDLTLGLLWGAPVALAFGLGGAVVASLLTMLLAAISVWYGGAVDGFIQRLTEINLVLPALPIAIMVYYLYSKSVWVSLGVMVVLSIFGSAIKTYRATFLQLKQAPYLEAAQAYGAGSGRIILFYLVPRIAPLLIPQMVTAVPGFVFLEATLSFVGVSDPYLPTWGKMIYEAAQRGAYNGGIHWLLQPIALLLLTGLAFALMGLALERIFNPRLREH